MGGPSDLFVYGRRSLLWVGDYGLMYDYIMAYLCDYGYILIWEINNNIVWRLMEINNIGD